MGIIKSIYDEHTHEDKVWYDSSNIIFTRFVENTDNNLGKLYVVFSNGGQYLYKDVDMPTDYILLKHGGIDGSQGKTLNSRIKGKYEYEKLENVLVEDIHKELQKVLADEMKEHTYFISGHGKITEDEFNKYYAEALYTIVQTDAEAHFVVGDFIGVDIMAQDYLINNLGLEPERITVYHMFDNPRHKNEKIKNTVGGFTCDDDRDTAMTNASGSDVAFIKPDRMDSCTARNILRRYLIQ